MSDGGGVCHLALSAVATWHPSERATRLILIRHTEPDPSMAGRCYGSLDVGLSARGAAHADALAELLSGLPVAAVYTSPLQRAAATAAPIGERHRLPPRRLDDLRELDFGRLEGLTFDRIEREWPRVHRAWMRSPTGVRFPGGERYADLERRARAAGREIRAGHPEATVVVVTHGGVVRAMLAEALVMPRRAVFAIEQRHGALNVVDWYGQTAVVRLVNGPPTAASLATAAV